MPPSDVPSLDEPTLRRAAGAPAAPLHGGVNGSLPRSPPRNTHPRDPMSGECPAAGQNGRITRAGTPSESRRGRLLVLPSLDGSGQLPATAGAWRAIGAPRRCRPGATPA
ncbi:hypothetical protein STVIR_7040 [Streptomyces viridochromogenes Tue57]|uniref:Uncharacterized protein n=1 Tax=Streptomyces viridochromogenes Tue57 TaxID=1160705 RepID=L8P739_STRVR|nr:hypothetical protein STVIR_7040 [Streptomyces viridochromogenes Tue57]